MSENHTPSEKGREAAIAAVAITLGGLRRDRWHVVEAADAAISAYLGALPQEDAVNSRKALIEALTDAQAALAMMIAPDAIKNTTVTGAFAAATAAEAKARAALSQARAG